MFLIFDDDAYSGPLLVRELESRGFGQVVLASDTLALMEQLNGAVDAVLINFRLDRPELLLASTAVKQATTDTPVLVTAAPGPAIAKVEAWAGRTGAIDLIFRKPLDDIGFFDVIDDLLQRRRLARELERRSSQLAQRLPEPARDLLNDPTSDLERSAELTEVAIVVTDVRNSSGHIFATPPRTYFAELNNRLREQASLVRANGGTVLKFLGDGLLATFRGAGRHHLAVRCAAALRDHDAEAASKGSVLHCGVGAAEGLVIAGYMGEPGHLQYDMIGGTVHLASRLCSLAGPGEALISSDLYTSAQLSVDDAQAERDLTVRGIAHPVQAVRLFARHA